MGEGADAVQDLGVVRGVGEQPCLEQDLTLEVRAVALRIRGEQAFGGGVAGEIVVSMPVTPYSSVTRAVSPSSMRAASPRPRYAASTATCQTRRVCGRSGRTYAVMKPTGVPSAARATAVVPAKSRHHSR
ncbi:hypothetical protein SAV14893_060350 [Streptomyces avermitilis]|uniref:Uncharacterized protein n=1 Tax=Streptomyces avermitilis TaxID=33903 RepID=A0A4D4M473_STRAX|nr:hypothetical protein SAVMC3_72670 [Streptomyces avermitilis]GDY66642.1 hypothetical protein SAV14893_060350 [Streptomyces avermitilis]